MFLRGLGVSRQVIGPGREWLFEAYSRLELCRGGRWSTVVASVMVQSYPLSGVEWHGCGAV
jgi:hypothetical protein